MKKKNLTQLKLKKVAVSALNTDQVSGGNGDTQFCFSINFCETIDYTACRGEYICQIYTGPEN